LDFIVICFAHGLEAVLEGYLVLCLRQVLEFLISLVGIADQVVQVAVTVDEDCCPVLPFKVVLDVRRHVAEIMEIVQTERGWLLCRWLQTRRTFFRSGRNYC
jgi:hypothetical protein